MMMASTLRIRFDNWDTPLDLPSHVANAVPLIELPGIGRGAGKPFQNAVCCADKNIRALGWCFYQFGRKYRRAGAALAAIWLERNTGIFGLDQTVEIRWAMPAAQFRFARPKIDENAAGGLRDICIVRLGLVNRYAVYKPCN